MRRLRVTTETGAEYAFDYASDGRIMWWHRGDFYGKVWRWHNLDPEELQKFLESGKINYAGLWGYVHAQPPVTEPEVGMRMYVSGSPSMGWRISTPVVSIVEEEFDHGDE